MSLEPCPFCGGEAEWRDDHGVCDVPFGLVVAHEKHCFLNHIAFEEADIIAAWNTRAPDPRIATLEAEVARLREALSNPPKHKFWGAGEPDCPRELKAGNGELRTLRCKVCGEDNPRDSICRWAIGTRESDSDAAMRFIDKLRADYGTVTILPDNEEADTKAEQVAIDCCGEWTNWQDQRFYGETILQCLAKAVVVQEKARAALEACNDK